MPSCVPWDFYGACWGGRSQSAPVWKKIVIPAGNSISPCVVVLFNYNYKKSCRSFIIKRRRQCRAMVPCDGGSFAEKSAARRSTLISGFCDPCNSNGWNLFGLLEYARPIVPNRLPFNPADCLFTPYFTISKITGGGTTMKQFATVLLGLVSWCCFQTILFCCVFE